MDRPTVEQIISQTLAEFDLSDTGDDVHIKQTTLTFWMPEDYKKKFDKLQKRTGRKYGKFLKEVLKKSLDAYPIEDEAG